MKRFTCARVLALNVLCGVFGIAGMSSAVGGVIDSNWIGGTGYWDVAGNWEPNLVPNNDSNFTYNVFIDHGRTGVNSNVTMDTTTWISNLTVDRGDSLVITYNRNTQCEANMTIGAPTGGTIRNEGTIRLSGYPYYYDIGARLILKGDMTLTGSGSLILDPENWFKRIVGDGGNRLTNDANHTIKGGGDVGCNTLAITNLGLFEQDEYAKFVFDPPDSPADGKAGVINDGIMRAYGSGLGGLYFTGGTFTNNGTIEAFGNTRVTFDATAILTNYDPNTKTLNGGTWRVIQGPPWNPCTYMTLTGRTILVNAGDVTVSGPASYFEGLETLQANAGEGKFRIIDGRTFQTKTGTGLTGDLSNAGEIEVGTDSNLAVSARYTQTGGLTTVNGRLSAVKGIDIQGGRLSGTGMVEANEVLLAGTVGPGNSVGKLTFRSLSLRGGAVYDFEIAGSAADLVEVTGPGPAFRIDPNGPYTVNVTVLDANNPRTEYALFKWAGDDPLTQQEFDNLKANCALNFQPGVSGELAYTQPDNQIVLTDVVIPEPGTVAILLTGALALLGSRQGRVMGPERVMRRLAKREGGAPR